MFERVNAAAHTGGGDGCLKAPSGAAALARGRGRGRGRAARVRGGGAGRGSESWVYRASARNARDGPKSTVVNRSPHRRGRPPGLRLHAARGGAEMRGSRAEAGAHPGVEPRRCRDPDGIVGEGRWALWLRRERR